MQPTNAPAPVLLPALLARAAATVNRNALARGLAPPLTGPALLRPLQ